MSNLRMFPHKAESADRLTPRECEVLSLAHLRNREIAEVLNIKTATVKTHIERILLKTGAETRTGAVAIWRERKAA